MDAFDIIGYFSTLIAVICLPINIIFLRLLYKFRHSSPFSSSFFDLCRQLTIIDITITIFSTAFFKLSLFGWFSKIFYAEKFAILPILGLNYLGHVQAIAIIGIALNRFTAVFSPHRHRDFWWNSTHMGIFKILQWTLPLILVLPMLFNNFRIEENEFLKDVKLFGKSQELHKIYFISIAILDGLIINIFVGALYFSIFYRIRTHIHMRKSNDLALRLATSAFLIFICYLMLGVFSILSALTPKSNPWIYRPLWFIANDILCSTNAPILLALNKPIRKKFLRLIGFKIASTQKSSILL